MGLRGIPKKVDFSWKTAFAIILVIFIVFGFVTKLVLSISMPLNSDSVGEGLQAMEIWKHQNYFLSGYYLPSQDTFLFTELIPFQLIPQIATGYSPLALKVMTYVEFVLGVATLSYIIYLIMGDLTCALVFAALAANVSPEAYQYFWLPTSHGGTIVFLGIMFALLIHMEKKGRQQPLTNKKSKRIRSPKILWPYILGLIVLVALTVVSDTIILPWLIIPYILVYLLFIREKSGTMNIAVASMAIVSTAVYIFKTYFVFTWVVQDIFAPRTTADFTSIVTLFYRALSLLLDPGLYSAVQGFKGFGIPEAISLLLFVALAGYAIKNALTDRSRRPIYGLILASGITMFAMWLISHYTVDMSSARYLTFTALTAFMLIAMALRPNDKVFSALVIALLATSAFFTIVQMGEFQHPNADEYGLIAYLKENNQTFGYGTYWKSNVVTYLSGEDVTVRQSLVYRDGLKPGMWLACERWYRSTPDRSFLLVDNSDIDDNAKVVITALTTSLNASEPLHYHNYDIYPLENYHIGSFQVKRY